MISLPRFNNDLPTPKDLLNPYFLNPSIQKSEQFESFFYEYVEDDEAMSSGSFSAGFFLEWSAYLHGLKSSLLRKEQLIRPIGQGEGLIFFIIITEIYLNQLEINHQEEFLSIKRSDEALELLRVLDSESKEVLQSFDYCSEYSADHSVLKTLNDITKTDTLKRLTEAEFTSNELLRDYLEN